MPSEPMCNGTDSTERYHLIDHGKPSSQVSMMSHAVSKIPYQTGRAITCARRHRRSRRVDRMNLMFEYLIDSSCRIYRFSIKIHTKKSKNICEVDAQNDIARDYVSGERGWSWWYCNTRPTRDRVGASSRTLSPVKNQINIEGSTWLPYQILSW